MGYNAKLMFPSAGNPAGKEEYQSMHDMRSPPWPPKALPLGSYPIRDSIFCSSPDCAPIKKAKIDPSYMMYLSAEAQNTNSNPRQPLSSTQETYRPKSFVSNQRDRSDALAPTPLSVNSEKRKEK